MSIDRPMFPPRTDKAQASPEHASHRPDVVQFPGKTKRRRQKRESAIADVKKSGYELVPARRVPKDRGKPLTDSEIGRMAFEPWQKDPGDMEAIGGEGWHNFGIDVRFAHAVMLMSKSDLIALHRDVDADHVDALMANIMRTHEFLKYIAAMMESALGRIIISACAAVDQGVLGDGKEPLNLEGFHRRPRLVVNKPS